MNKTIYLIFFILISLLILKQKQDNFVNFCQPYNNANQHCPYRVKFKDGVSTYRPGPLTIDINKECKCDCDKKKVEAASLYDKDILNGTYLVQQNKNNIVSPKCKEVAEEEKKPEFIMFADKYPVKIKSKKNNTKICGK